MRDKAALEPAGAGDQELVCEVLAGGEAAFAELARRHRDRLERLCRRFFRDNEIVRDLVQESFLKALNGLASYRAEMPFGGWLRSITINLCYDELRRRHRHPEELVDDLSGVEAAWADMVEHATPERIVQEAQRRHEAHDLAHRLLEALRPEDRMVMILKESEEMSVAQIAEEMGWSEAKVKIRAFRARRAMRKQAEHLLAFGLSREWE